MYQDGDVILGGLFQVHFFTVFPDLSFKTEPEPPYCEKFDIDSFQQAQTMAFAIDEINKNPNLLPNITLGYHLSDNCVRLGMAFRAAISLVSGTEKSFSNLNCTGPPPVVGIVGDTSSTPSIAISSVLGLFRVPIVSYYATCSCLSDRKKYPSFFRTIPNDAFQVRAMVQILRHFGWTWVGLIYSDDDYGIYAAQSFQQEMQLFGGCVAFSEILPHDNNHRDIHRIIGMIQASTARVVVVFSTSSFLLPLMDEVVSQNMTGRQWIASEAWASEPEYHTPRLLPFLGGTLGIAVRRGEIQGLHDFLLRIRPSNEPRNNMLRIFWENMFRCSYETGGTVKDGEQVKKVCTGQEDLSTIKTPYTDVSGLRAPYNVYKAVYALAHALHDLIQCEKGRGPFSGNGCADITNLKPWQVRPTASVLTSDTCQLQGRFRLNSMYQDGDVILGGLFQVHFFTVFPDLSFKTEPEPPYCEKFDMESFQQAQTMAFAIDEINKNPNLLPNITLGYHLSDNCVRLGMAFRAAISLVSGTEKSFSNLNCTGPPPVVGIVGDPSSTPSIAISSVLGLFRVPIVSYYATCSCLSDRKKYPSFFRTIPSDAFQVRAMVQILRHFGWTWVGLIYSDDDYGIYAAQSFQQEMQLFGHCVAFSEILPHDNNHRDIHRIIGMIQASTARVVVVFSTSSFLLPLMDEVVSQNMTGRQWIASEAWATAPVYHTPRLLPFLGGTLGIAVRRGEIQGLHDFLLRIRPSNEPRNNMLRIFWENMFRCSYETGGTVKDGEQVKKVCTGQEDLSTTNTPYTDVSGLRAPYNVYKAVYALAHALHDLIQCEKGRGPFSGNGCADITNLKPWQLVHYLQKVNFTTGFGDHVSFDKNGDALAIYDVLNWQPSSDGSIRIYTVGVVNEEATTGMVLTLDEDAIYWNFETKKVTNIDK
ncbi:hypothetical protein G5714_017948 [Onychostoma macrolepis]|uniref:Receptor ligand binding region domain-containing protein n=1 Tax=Onychostoma macrolepis TaxID=369639 RepID=A0A7J6C2R8_9TELE|nr:hypothetical protein G5714_017948 [Onychostoma macrolepis]